MLHNSNGQNFQKEKTQTEKERQTACILSLNIWKFPKPKLVIIFTKMVKTEPEASS